MTCFIRTLARAVLAAISHLAGTFVVATAGPALESVLAARGAGADVYAREHRKWVLHLDIGGGTTNLARIDPQGKIVETGCLNVGGRLVKLDPQGTVTYVSPVLKGFPAPRVGERATPETLSPLLDRLVAVLEEALRRQRRGLMRVTNLADEWKGERRWTEK